MSGTAQTLEGHDDRRAKRNVILLAACQAMASSNASVNATLGSIIGQYLAADKTLATLPVSTMLIGVVVTTMPASLFMRRVGRRTGFMTAAVIGMAGAALVTLGLFELSFATVCWGTFLLGVYHAFAQYFRFAAADTASPAFRPRAISLVLAGGVVAAFLGPEIVIYAKDLFAPVQFAGAYAMLVLLGAIAFVILAFVDIPPPKAEVFDEPARALFEIMKQRPAVIAIAAGMASFAMMVFVMTATPLAMLACSLQVDDAAFVIQWHVVAMFAPSFFTGHLIARYGTANMMMIGLALMFGCGAAALMGIDIAHFWVALVLLGLGWNFSFVSATHLFTTCYRPAERNKAQGANDLFVFGSVALASLLSGALFQWVGWNWVLAMMMAVCLAAFVMVVVWRFTSAPARAG
jgi:predicted MFS family arabinose efflux permease